MGKFPSISPFHRAEEHRPRGRKIKFHIRIVIPEKLRELYLHTNNPDRFIERNVTPSFIPDEFVLKKKKMGSP
jgi:hypothetical protein